MSFALTRRETACFLSDCLTSVGPAHSVGLDPSGGRKKMNKQPWNELFSCSTELPLARPFASTRTRTSRGNNKGLSLFSVLASSWRSIERTCRKVGEPLWVSRPEDGHDECLWSKQNISKTPSEWHVPCLSNFETLALSLSQISRLERRREEERGV